MRIQGVGERDRERQVWGRVRERESEDTGVGERRVRIQVWEREE